MTPSINSINQLTKKLNAIILCHLPIVCAAIFVALGFDPEAHADTGIKILYALAAVSFPPAFLLLMQKTQADLDSSNRGANQLERLTWMIILLVHALILISFVTTPGADTFRFLSLLELGVLSTYLFQTHAIANKNNPPIFLRVMVFANLFVLLILCGTIFFSQFFNDQFEILMAFLEINIFVTGSSATWILFKENFPHKNSRFFAIVSYSMVQSSIVSFVLPPHHSHVIASTLSLGTIFALSLDFILLKPKALIENGFSFLNTKKVLEEKIAKVSEDLREQERKTDDMEKQLSDAIISASTTLDSMSAQVCTLDSTGKIISINNAWKTLFSREEMNSKLCNLGENFFTACSNEESSRENPLSLVCDGINKLMNQPGNELLLQLMFSRGPDPLWFLCRISEISSSLGKRYLIVLEDITQLKKKEEELLLKSFAIESANDGIVLTDPTLPDNPVVYVSQGFLKLTGYSEQDVLGRNCRFMQGPETDPHMVQKIREAIAAERSFDGELINYTKDGRPWYNRLKLEPVRNKDGRLIRYVGVQLNVTEARKLDTERKIALRKEQSARQDAERLYREAQNANTIKDEFLATLSHELRTPAGVIVGFTELLKYEELDPLERDEALEALERNSRALVTLIDDMLDMSRVVTGKFKLNPKPVDLTSIVESVISAEILAAQAKNIRIVTEFEPGAGPVFGDTTRLQQIFWNLLSNAIKFTPRNGRVKVSLHTEGHRMSVRVSDTGIGIESKFLPHVFERFRQQEGGMNRHYGGLGLGLSIVKHLVELHGGTVTAESAGIGRGSTFTVTLPAITSAG